MKHHKTCSNFQSKTDYSSVFQLYFYDHLFSSNNDSKILDLENLPKNTVPTL